MRALLLVLSLLGLVTSAQADQSVRGEGFIVHWSAVNTNALTADVAQRLGVQRRASHALVVLSPRREPASAAAAEPASKPVSAAASGIVRRLTGQRQDLRWREVEAGGQRDLIAEFEIQDGEHLAFDISVKPDGASYPLSIRFSRQFYRD